MFAFAGVAAVVLIVALTVAAFRWSSRVGYRRFVISGALAIVSAALSITSTHLLAWLAVYDPGAVTSRSGLTGTVAGPVFLLLLPGVVMLLVGPRKGPVADTESGPRAH